MGRSPRPNRLSRALLLIAPYGAAAVLVAALRFSGIAESLNLLLYDLITHLRPAPSGAATPITIIGISEADISRHGWPIDDRLLCQAIDTLSAEGARAIGFDLYRNKGVGPQQECLRRQARTNPRLVSIFNVAESIGPIPGTPPQRQAFNDLVVDADGVVRRDLVHVAGQDAATVALPLRLVEVFRGNGELRRRLETGPGVGAGSRAIQAVTSTSMPPASSSCCRSISRAVFRSGPSISCSTSRCPQSRSAAGSS